MKLRISGARPLLDLEDPEKASDDSDYESEGDTSETSELSVVVEGEDGEEGEEGEDDECLGAQLTDDEDEDEQEASGSGDRGHGDGAEVELASRSCSGVSSSFSGSSCSDFGGGVVGGGGSQPHAETDAGTERDVGAAEVVAAAFNPFSLLTDEEEDEDEEGEGEGEGYDNDEHEGEEEAGVQVEERQDEEQGQGEAEDEEELDEGKDKEGGEEEGGKVPEEEERVQEQGEEGEQEQGEEALLVAVEERRDEEETADATGECWVCYGSGRVASCKGACTSGRDGRQQQQRQQGAGDDDLVAPCGVCAGGVRYIHRRCLTQWLESSWAIACPNCRTLYDSCVLDDFTDGVALRGMLASSCPPGYDARRPFPPHSMVHFCVGGTVEVCMACGGFTAARLLRRIRLMADEWAARGGDGGLGLVRDDGSMLVLPCFDITALVLDLGPGAALSQAGGGVAAVASDLAVLSDSDEDLWGPDPARSQRGGAVGAYADHVVGADGYALDDGSSDNDPNSQFMSRTFRDPYHGSAAGASGSHSGSGAPPLTASRERNLVSGSASGNGSGGSSRFLHPMLAELRQQQHQYEQRQPMHLRALQGMRFSLQHHAPAADIVAMTTAAEVLRQQWSSTADWLAELRPGEAAVAGLVFNHQPEWVDLVQVAADRAVHRAEQQRRREDLLRQQRVQQRHSGSSRGHQAMAGPPHRSAGRRR